MNGNNNSSTAPKKRMAKKRGRFNLIDFLLVLVLLLIIGALVYVFLPSSVIKNITADKSEEIQYSI